MCVGLASSEKAAKAKIVSYAQELSGLKAAAYQWQSEAERHLQQLQRRSMRWPPHASSSSTNSEALGESMGGVKEQLQSLAKSDAQGVRSLVLSVLAMIQDDDQQQQAEGRSGAAGGGGGGKAEPGEKGGGRAQGAREAGSEAGAGETPKWIHGCNGCACLVLRRVWAVWLCRQRPVGAGQGALAWQGGGGRGGGGAAGGPAWQHR